MKISIVFGIAVLAPALWGQSAKITVPGASQIALAGQPAGISTNGDTAPLNAPAQAMIGFFAGQGFAFTATGLIGLFGNQLSTPPDGGVSSTSTAGGLGIAGLRAAEGSLIGVFVADQIVRTNEPPDVDFRGAARDLEVVIPLLQQPFFIGSGLTSQGRSKTFIAPARATRLFLGIAGYSVSRNAGSFAVVAILVPVPEPPGNSVRVMGTAQITLAGQPVGATYNGDTAPPNAPVQIQTPIAAGQAFTFSANGLVGIVGNNGNTPDGANNSTTTGGSSGIAQIRASAGSLIGIFLPDSIDRNSTPPGTDYRGAAYDLEVVAPLLQQPFFIGYGTNSFARARTYIAPARATRLFLGITGYSNSGNGGFFDVTASSVDPPATAGNPLYVLGSAQLGLAGRPVNGSWNGDSGPPNQPPHAIVSLVAGNGIKITATGLIGGAGSAPDTTPDGSNNSTTTGGSNGIGSIRAPSGALIGIFLSDQFSSASMPPAVDFTGASKDAPQLAPLLQQPFLIGSGKTSDGTLKTFIVPIRATHLLLGITCYSCAGNTGNFLVTVTPDGPNTPAIPQTGAVTGYTFGPSPYSPGSLISIFGSNFSLTSIISTDVPLPTKLGDTQVLFDTTPAPLFLVSPSQIDVQIPWEMNKDKVQICVSRAGAASLPVTITLTPYRPTILTVDGRYAIAWNTDTGSVVNQVQPAVGGSNLALYATGLGPVSPVVPSGFSAPADTPSTVTSTLTVVVGKTEVPSNFGGLAPGLVGIYQVVFTLPAGASSGTNTLQLKIGGAISPIAELPVQ